MLSACTQSACPFVIFQLGLLAVPQPRSLERGTLFYAAETASPISLGRRKKGEDDADQLLETYCSVSRAGFIICPDGRAGSGT